MADTRAWPAYRTLWVWLLLGWTVSAADRALTGPVVTWMIENDVGFLSESSKPFALGGLIGEIGAVLSPAVSGALRDATGGWEAAIFLDAALIGTAALLFVFVRERSRSAMLGTEGPSTAPGRRFTRDAAPTRSGVG